LFAEQRLIGDRRKERNGLARLGLFRRSRLRAHRNAIPTLGGFVGDLLPKSAAVGSGAFEALSKANDYGVEHRANTALGGGFVEELFNFSVHR
jgi:hypothetical protein